MLIYLDAGHGGKDSGAVAHGLREKDLTLNICKIIGKELRAYENVKVMFSRSDDKYISLVERARKANQLNADVLISVHINASTKPIAEGFESYIFPNSNSATTAMQNVLHEEIIKSIGSSGFGITDRGKKQRNLAILRDTKMKAILTENLFITNQKDAKLLMQSDFIEKIAKGHVIGLQKFLGLKKSAQPPPQPDQDNKIYIVQVGAYEDKKNAEAVVKDLNKYGYRPVIKTQ